MTHVASQEPKAQTAPVLPKPVCIDASLVIKFVSPEPDSPRAEALFQKWKDEKVGLIAPYFAAAEMDSVLRHKVVRGELTSEVADAAFQVARRLPIQFDPAEDCRERAWQIATQLGFSTVYDAVYLALAERRGCEFWTADGKLYERVKERLGFVKLLSTQES